jgi:ABC-type antimicrobial peptide transport system permease subunit
VLALALSAVGLYGLISYNVAQRTNEIGIRVALGAERSDVLGMVLRQGGRLAVAGSVAGILIGIVLMHVMRSFLYGVSKTDPLTFAAVLAAALLLGAVTLLACYVPAQRATKVDPIEALRYE